MIPDNVTLIVKAPNQQIEDQNIQCQSSWTVRQLKGYLSEVYPSKPKTDDQKIIYSGQLLEDNSILKDVLRTYDTEIAHTMHLVCKPGRNMPIKEKQQQQQKPAETASGPDLRQRDVAQTVTERPTQTPPRPETRQNDQNHSVEMQNYMNSFVNNYGRVPPYPHYNFGEGYLQAPLDPAAYANHMMMIQQAYLQYMQQYANMQRVAPEQGREVEQREVHAPPAQPAEARPPAAEEAPPRDWLDQVYAASRLAILLSLVCLYGSPARLLLVLLLAVAGYLHQIGFFRDLHVGQNNGQPAASAQDAEPTRHQSLLASTWIVVTSFFASLIPDIN